MAIDRTGISSLDAGASDITYSGNEGPQDPRAMTDIEKIILQHWLQQGGSYGDDIPEEFKQQIIQIYGLDRDRSAEGGIARLGYANGQLVQPGKSDLKISAGLLKKAAPDNHLLAYITPNERDMLVQAGGSGKMTPQGIPSFYVGEGMDFLTEANDVSAPSTSSGSEHDNHPESITNADLAAIDRHRKTVENIVQDRGDGSSYEDRYNQMVKSHGGTPQQSQSLRKALIGGAKTGLELKHLFDIGTGRWDRVGKNVLGAIGAKKLGSPIGYNQGIGNPWSNPNLIYNETTGEFEDKLGDVVDTTMSGATFAKAYSTEDMTKLLGITDVDTAKKYIEDPYTASPRFIPEKSWKDPLTQPQAMDKFYENLKEQIEKHSDTKTFQQQRDASFSGIRPEERSLVPIDFLTAPGDVGNQKDFSDIAAEIEEKYRMAEGGIARLGYRGGKIIKGQEHMLAYITPGEAKTLEKLGGQETMTKEGIPAYPEFDYYGQDKKTFEGGTGHTSTGGEDKDWSPAQEKMWEKAEKKEKKEERQREKEQKKAEKIAKRTDKASKKVKAKIINLLKTKFKDDPDYEDEDWDELSWDQILDFRSALDPTGEKWDERYFEHGTAPKAWTGTGPWIGQFMAAPDFTQSQFDLLVNKGMGKVPTKDETGKYIKPVYDEGTKTYTSGFEKWQPSDPKEADWLEEMKFNNPHQYALYTGQTHNLHTGEFTPIREDGYGGVPDAHPLQSPTTQSAATQSAATQSAATNQQAASTGLGGINPAHHSILAKQYGFDDTPQGISNFLAQYPMFAADGGRAGYAGGGIADLRQGYFLGKLVKKFTKGIKKLGKSKLGKAAMMAALYGYGPRILTGGMGEGFLGAKGTGWGDLIWKTTKEGGKRNVNLARLFGIPMILGAATADEGDNSGSMYDYDELARLNKYWGPKFDESNFQRQRLYSADGGRIGYAGGKLAHKTAYLKSLYDDEDEDEVQYAQEGGLMNLGGMEKDYRNDGGFVPIGGQERADDVPARLSKNEFVFTADAVRAAGGGDIDAGAEIMENVMENLEQGGEISQQSQGLEGARNMFATSQRLEGVL